MLPLLLSTQEATCHRSPHLFWSCAMQTNRLTRPIPTSQGLDRLVHTSCALYIPEKFSPLDFISAAAISKHSVRPYETVEALARKTGKPIDATFGDEDYSALAQTLLSTPQYAGNLRRPKQHSIHISSSQICLSILIGSDVMEDSRYAARGLCQSGEVVISTAKEGSS